MYSLFLVSRAQDGRHHNVFQVLVTVFLCTGHWPVSHIHSCCTCFAFRRRKGSGEREKSLVIGAWTEWAWSLPPGLWNESELPGRRACCWEGPESTQVQGNWVDQDKVAVTLNHTSRIPRSGQWDQTPLLSVARKEVRGVPRVREPACTGTPATGGQGPCFWKGELPAFWCNHWS